MNRITLYFLLISSFVSAQNPGIVRGPYLQSPGPNSIILRWRTDIPTNSRVYYGQSFGSMSLYKDSLANTTEHRIQLTGLFPNTKYYYIIGNISQSLRGPDSLLHFTTAPDPLVPTPVRLWVIGDFGRGNQGQVDVSDAYTNYSAARPADLWLWLGDNVYYSGTDVEYQDKVFASTSGYYHLFPNLPFVPTPGNHDYEVICPVFCNKNPNIHTGPYFDIIDQPTQGELGGAPSNTELFYSFDYGDIHFISLNSEIGSGNQNYDWLGLYDSDTSFTSPMIEWLKADLAATEKKWKIAIWHRPPYSFHPSLTEFEPFAVATREHFNPSLERFGVDLVLAGHDHTYQRSYLINGHYLRRDSFTVEMMIDSSSGKDDLGEAYVKYTDGPDAGKGTVYSIVGNSGIGDDYIPVNHPAIYWGHICDTCIGSLIIDIDGNRLDAKYITADEEILDEFTILKRSTTGIDTKEQRNRFAKIYPNPFGEDAIIEFYVSVKGSYQLELFNLVGKKIFSEKLNITMEGKHQFQLNATQYEIPSGIYIIKISDDESEDYSRVVKM
jgi:hypothetical protein